MRNRIFLLLVILCSALAVGLVIAQDAPDAPFTLISEIGQVRPRGIQYDSNFDRFAWTDPRGQLVLVDAATLEPLHILYETGLYNAYKFSNDGQYLALAVDIRIEIWDTNTGEQLLSFTPDGALRVEAPLYWSNDDSLLSFNTQVRAPRAVRRSENDTTNLPWVWDVASEFGERLTVLRGARAIPFFDYRNGFVFGEHLKAVVGLPERLQVLDITQNGTNVIGEIPAQRFEPDPVIAWSSLLDDMLYVRPDNGSSTLVQVNTAEGRQLDLPIGADLRAGRIDDFADLQFSRLSRVVGQPRDTVGNSFMRLLLGSDYEAQFSYNPLTIQLVDILEPETPSAGRILFLLYIFDGERDFGRFELVGMNDVNQIVLHPDEKQIMVRRASGTQRIEVYDLTTGSQVQSYLPTLPDPEGTTVLAYAHGGDIIISDFERIDAETGDILTQNLHYNPGFSQFYWNDNSETILTYINSEVWEWDIHTREVIRREEVDILGEFLDISPDGERILTRIAEGAGIEIVEVGTEERPRIVFDNLPNVFIEQVVPAPNWENFLIVYSVNGFGQHAPGNEIMLFNIDRGALWHMAGDDLPFMNNRQYGWVDNDTVYIYGEEGSDPPTRIYGLDYTASGVPDCIADQFPANLPQWVELWEVFNQRLSGERLNRLSQNVCLLTADTPDDVTDYLFPTTTPTRLPVTATPSVIAGVPVCITNRFPSEAQEYARIWQDMSEGLTDEEKDRLELLICEDLGGQRSPQEDIAEPTPEFTNKQEVITVNIHSGHRQVSSFIPPLDRPFRPNIAPIAENFRRTFGRTPDGKISPNGEFFAIWAPGQFIQIYRMNDANRQIALQPTPTPTSPYDQQSGTRVVSLRPTATEGYTFLGDIRPTLTPTVTPTSPPRAEVTEELVARDAIVEMCPYTEHFTMDNLPPDYAASGRMIVDLGESGRTYVLHPDTGNVTWDDTLPLCLNGGTCNMSPDGQWIVTVFESIGIWLTRPDYSDPVRLFYPEETWLYSEFQWTDSNLLRYTEILLPSADRQFEKREVHVIDPNTLEPVPQPDYEDIDIYDLRLEVLSIQPVERVYALVRAPFNTERGNGYRYYMYNQATEEAFYFARINTPDSGLEYQWHSDGTSLWYRFPDNRDWYRFDAATREHRLFGDFPSTYDWSPDGRYRLGGYNLTYDENQERIENGEPVPNLRYWDSQTGQSTLYCLPGFEHEGLPNQLYWSPDGRYVAFQGVLIPDRQYEFAPNRTFVLDLQTGSMTELSILPDRISMWIPDEGSWR